MNFADRHIGVSEKSQNALLSEISCNSIDELMSETIPNNLIDNRKIGVGQSMSESEYLKHIRTISEKNQEFKSFIGMGYYGTLTPSVILRNILENPGWYTQYTPYQAEISQGRLESLLNFQTMISELTELPIANASLLDESTAAAEAMNMIFHNSNKGKTHKPKFFLDKNTFPQTIAVLQTKAAFLDIDLIIDDIFSFQFNEEFAGCIVQNPNINGDFNDLSEKIAELNELKIPTCCIVDIMSLVVMKTPAEMGAVCAVGNSQRFGVPMGYGGPHAAFFATTDDYKRLIPGRIIGVSEDRKGKKALRMALQTREQHIRREKATSNICTAQALLANMAAMYAVYHGPENLKSIALDIHNKINRVRTIIEKNGKKVLNGASIFDTITVECENSEEIKKKALELKINFFYDKNIIRISLDEATTEQDVQNIISIFNNSNIKTDNSDEIKIHSEVKRTSEPLTHEIFKSYHTETLMMRYIKYLEDKDLSLTKSMIPLGSCTMKLNAASTLIPLSWSKFGNIHPFAPTNQVEGYTAMINTLEKDLAKITGFAATSVQPNSGAQGEFSGLAVIRNYQKSIGQGHRNIVLIPSSAHGTNPASAVLAGLKVVVSKADENGNIDVEDLKAKAIEHSENLSCLMVTYPSTHGIFEEKIKEVCKIIHENGGQIYMDGANMNAQIGWTSPGFIGADVCHLNLHKTFAIPHGGGGPGVGPICVAAHLVDFLPSHPLVKTGGKKSEIAISSAPYGSASILTISYGYIKMLGDSGLKKATEIAILNANYIKTKLEEHFDILYVGDNGRVAHELIVDFRPYKHSVGIEVEDIAKRLMDYGIHAPTVSFPVAGTIMIEPTESEDKKEIDRFIDAMISIKNEIEEIKNGEFTQEDNVLKNAPHTAEEAICGTWEFPYSREKAIFPVSDLKENKFWVSVSRVNNSLGDRNLICTCPPMEEYM